MLRSLVPKLSNWLKSSPFKRLPTTPAFSREPYGYKWGEKPSPNPTPFTSEEWHIIRVFSLALASMYLYSYWPEDLPDQWAHKQAVQRMLKRGVDLNDLHEELSVYFSMDFARLKTLWKEYEEARRLEGAQKDASYVLRYPSEVEPWDWQEALLQAVPVGVSRFLGQVFGIC